MLSAILANRPARSSDDVVRMISEIDAALLDEDGLMWFNRLYLEVTLAVNAAVAAGAFQDPAFVTSLDVVFANLYFDAAAAGDSSPALAPPAWRPLFGARHAAGIARIQYALAGMNAHINRDLPQGIVTTHEELGGAPSRTGARHDDFERVNAILDAVETRAKTDVAVGLIADHAMIAHGLDDLFAMWSIRAAREAAWTHAEVLWALRSTPSLRRSFFSSLDEFTGFAGRGLLASPLLPVVRV
jgi:hypothetical protein